MRSERRDLHLGAAGGTTRRPSGLRPPQEAVGRDEDGKGSGVKMELAAVSPERWARAVIAQTPVVCAPCSGGAHSALLLINLSPELVYATPLLPSSKA